MMLRPRDPDDDAIAVVRRQAFGSSAPDVCEPVEWEVGHALRADVGWLPALSVEGKAAGATDGHVVCSEGSLGAVCSLKCSGRASAGRSCTR